MPTAAPAAAEDADDPWAAFDAIAPPAPTKEDAPAVAAFEAADATREAPPRGYRRRRGAGADDVGFAAFEEDDRPPRRSRTRPRHRRLDAPDATDPADAGFAAPARRRGRR